jgi:2-methylcitrate dehydratase
LLDLIIRNPDLLAPERIDQIIIKAYEPAFGIIGDPAKRDPKTRQSADHSMVYIVATMLRKAVEAKESIDNSSNTDDLWQKLMLSPYDYDKSALHHPLTRALMSKIDFEHGGPEYDAKYPDGIPTSLVVTFIDGKNAESGLVMYPAGHARNNTANLNAILDHKFNLLGSLALPEGTNIQKLVAHLNDLPNLSAEQLEEIYSFEITHRPGFE